MGTSIQTTVEIFTLNDKLYEKAFEKLDEDSSRKRFNDETNSAIWILGHLVTTRHHLAQLIGLDVAMPWGGLFTKSISDIDPSLFPGLEEISSVWVDITGRIMSRLTELDDSDLSDASPIPFPTEENSIRAAIVFLAQHESYHIGQLSFIRKMLRQDGLFNLQFNVK